MNNLENLFGKHPLGHHAYMVESPVSLVADIELIIKKECYSYVFAHRYDSFKIADAREIKQLQSQRTEKSSLFILDIAIINVEAQNALLKIIEEPTVNTFFIFITPSRYVLLPTLRSRLEIITYKVSALKPGKIDLEIFFSQPLQKVFEYIKSLTDDKSEEKISKDHVIYFCNELESALQNRPEFKKILPTIFTARDYVHSNGASIKMILDNIAMHIAAQQKK